MNQKQIEILGGLVKLNNKCHVPGTVNFLFYPPTVQSSPHGLKPALQQVKKLFAHQMAAASKPMDATQLDPIIPFPILFNKSTKVDVSQFIKDVL